jgi:hypothetical protein
MWKIKTFKTLKELNRFKDANKNKFQMVEVFLNNSFGLDCKKLKKITF